MTDAEADALAKRIINTWHGYVPLAEWVEELRTLDAGQAGTAYARLKHKNINAPSIAEFYAEYHALDTHDAINRPNKCGWCDDTGWTETRRHTRNGQVYTGWQPCTQCPEGRARELSETWLKAPVRDFITDAEADRLIRALKEIP